GPYHGHYIALVKSNNQWILFDDDVVLPVNESDLHKYFGDASSNGTGYLFFYQTADYDSTPFVNSMRSMNSTNVAATSSEEEPSISSLEKKFSIKKLRRKGSRMADEDVEVEDKQRKGLKMFRGRFGSVSGKVLDDVLLDDDDDGGGWGWKKKRDRAKSDANSRGE
ncbi:hypothetical protein HK096_005832, partial [Nowakowskiella sp. JEL0078]